MHQAISAVDIDESAEISQAGHTSGADLTFFQLFNHTFFNRVAGFAAGCAFREDQPPAISVYLDHADFNFLADHFTVAFFRRIACDRQPAAKPNLRGGHKAANGAQGHQEAAFVEAFNFGSERVFRFKKFFSGLPVFFF